jgi:hypothetical protein
VVSFFQSVHAGLFALKEGVAGDIGEVSVVAARVSDDNIEIAGAGRCAAYRVTGNEVRRMLPTDEQGAEQYGLGTSLKVSMEMVKRSFSDEATYVLTSRRVDNAEARAVGLIEGVRGAATNAQGFTTALFGEEGGGFAIVESEKADANAARPEVQPETPALAWYAALREEINKGPSAPLNVGGSQGVSGKEVERPTEQGRVGVPLPSPDETEDDAREETIQEARGEVGGLPALEVGQEPAECIQEPPVANREIPELEAGHPERLAEGAGAGAPGTAAGPQVPWERRVLEPIPAPARAGRRRTVTLSVRSLGILAAAVALCAAAYAFWAGHDRVFRLFSSIGTSGERGGEPGGLNAGGALVLGSVPSGAEVIIDNRVLGSRTPVSTAAVSPGTHEVKLRLGELGEWAGSVSLRQGDTTRVNVAFIGGISVSSGSKQGLSVFVDNELKAYTPCLLESIPAGVHVVRVEGEGFSPWQEEVVVSYGGISDVQVKPGKLPSTGQVRISSRVMTEEGFEDAGGAAVFLDGKRVGATPAKIDAKPGLHSIKVGELQGHSPSVFVIDVRPGGKHFIRAEFGGGEPIVIDCLETRAPGGELMVYASLVNKREAVLSDVSLYVEKSGGAQVRWQPMVLVPGSRGVYAAVVPESILSSQGVVKYFARARTSDGVEYYSEVRTLQGR